MFLSAMMTEVTRKCKPNSGNQISSSCSRYIQNINFQRFKETICLGQFNQKIKQILFLCIQAISKGIISGLGYLGEGLSTTDKSGAAIELLNSDTFFAVHLCLT